MATSHIRSIKSSIIKFIKKKLCSLASKFCLLFSKPQAATTHVNELSESHSEHKSIEGMRTSCSPNINEVSVQVKYKSKRYRSRYDIHVNLCQQNLRRKRSRAVSRIPTTQFSIDKNIDTLSANIMEETLLNVSFLAFQVIMDDKVVRSIDLGGTD